MKPLSKISFSFKVQVLTGNIGNVREKSNSCIFHLPEVGQASLGSPAQENDQEGRKEVRGGAVSRRGGGQVHSLPWVEGHRGPCLCPAPSPSSRCTACFIRDASGNNNDCFKAGGGGTMHHVDYTEKNLLIDFSL